MEFFSTTFCGAKITKGGGPPKTVKRSCELDLEGPTNRTAISNPEDELDNKLTELNGLINPIMSKLYNNDSILSHNIVYHHFIMIL